MDQRSQSRFRWDYSLMEEMAGSSTLCNSSSTTELMSSLRRQNKKEAGQEAAESLATHLDTIPSHEEMQGRQRFRRSISEQIVQHRRIHPHERPRSILWALSDRQTWGGAPNNHTIRQRQSSFSYVQQQRKQQQHRAVESPVKPSSLDSTKLLDAGTSNKRLAFSSPSSDNVSSPAASSFVERRPSPPASCKAPKLEDGSTRNKRVRDESSVAPISSPEITSQVDSMVVDPKHRRSPTSAATHAVPPSVPPSSLPAAELPLSSSPGIRRPQPLSIFEELQHFSEYASITRYQAAFLDHLGGRDAVNAETGERPPSSSAVSTISVAFAPDNQTMASTHGDHTVKITGCSTGRLLQVLEGHPRTPWTVKYHPYNPNIVASGCLGFQVRVWNWRKGQCLHMIRLDYAIISLSFHSSGHILAIASGSRLHFWDYENYAGRREQETGRRAQRGVLTEVEQRHMLRCVHFPPGGRTIIVGGMNPQDHNDASRNNRNSRNNRGGMSGGGISFYLRLWDFDLDAALHPEIHSRVNRKPMANVRTIVPRALLYNDGGFDVSPDGKVLCACAEYWLPDGVDNAMELLQKEQSIFDAARDESMADEEESDDDMEDEDIMDKDGGNSGDCPITPRNAASPMPGMLQKSQPESSILSTPPISRTGLAAKGAGSFMSPPRQRSQHQQPPSIIVAPPPPRPPAVLPITPPNPTRNQLNLSPPSPPGRRWQGGLHQVRRIEDRTRPGSTGTALQPFIPNASTSANAATTGRSTSAPGGGIPPPPPPPPPSGSSSHQSRDNHASGNSNSGGTSHQSLPNRPPHPLSVLTGGSTYMDMTNRPGRFVPHVVTVSLDTSKIAPSFVVPVAPASATPTTSGGRQITSVARGHRPRLGQLLQACPLDGAKASAVTCVKFSPSADFCLLGYGVREPLTLENGQDSRFHPVTALYRINHRNSALANDAAGGNASGEGLGMKHLSTMISSDDDVNIARFHPNSGYGFVYGTKQGRVRVLSSRPWNYYYSNNSTNNA